ncbi:MAG: alpha/beta hydrolase [Prolixibacteraceae bacterium]|nr:alpha/beta hydrolase [Prolixibacteraceae bacterium]
MKKICTILLISWVMTSIAQDYTLKVWPDGAPDSNGLTVPEEKYDGVRVRNVSEAEMYVFLPAKEKNSGAAVVICPGGGYSILAMDHEGYNMARWMAEKGVAGIVLKYRLPNGHHQIPSGDARQAIRTVRANAAKWGIDPAKIGVAGSSAGGHLASTVGTRFDGGDGNAANPIAQMSCRPDFMLLLYPVISFREDIGHMGSRQNLIGQGNNWELAQQYSNELHVTYKTPPTFLVLADDDRGVVPENSIEFYAALKKHNIPAEMHIFQKGGHGFGMNKNGIPADNWPDLFYNWLKAIGVIK